MECPVCFEELTASNSNILLCNHKLCINCTNKLRTKTCPLCRRPFYINKINNEDNEEQDVNLLHNFFDDDNLGENYSIRTRTRTRTRNRTRNRNRNRNDVILPPPTIISFISVDELNEINNQINPIIQNTIETPILENKNKTKYIINHKNISKYERK